MAKRRILAVDDALVMRLMYKVALGEEYDLDIAENPVDAFAKITTSKEKYDLMITDLTMPEMSGVALLEKIRTIDGYRHMPVLFISNKSESEEQFGAKEAGSCAWLVKPIGTEKILSEVRKYLS